MRDGHITGTSDPDKPNISPVAESSDSDLASTGFAGSLWLIAITAALIVVGLIIVAVRARRNRHNPASASTDGRFRGAFGDPFRLDQTATRRRCFPIRPCGAD